MTELQQPFERVFLRHPQPMWVFRLRDLAFLAVNDAAIDTYGYSREEFLGMTLHDIRPKSEVPKLLADLRTVDPEGYSPSEHFIHRKKDGTLLHVRISAHGITMNGESARLVTVFDMTAEHEAVQALRAQRAHSEKIIENMIDGLAVLRADGSVDYANSAIRRMLDLDDGDIPDNYLDHFEIYEPDGSTRIRRQDLPLLRALGGEAVIGAEVVVVSLRSGRRLRLLANASPLFAEDGRVHAAVLVLHDVTQAFETQQTLKQRERSLAALMSNLPGMVYRVGADSKRTLEFVSSGSKDLLGLSSDELLAIGSEGFLEMVHPEDRDAVMANWQDLDDTLAGDRTFHRTYRVIARDGVTKWIWERGTALWDGPNGRPGNIEGIAIDITERVNAENALAESEARYRALFENAVEGIFRTSADGRLLMANPAAMRLFGADPDSDPRDHNVTAHFVDPSDRQAYLEQLGRDGFVRDKILALRREDGAEIWVKENSRAIRDEAGAMVEVEGTLEDITERVAAERALRESEERFARATLGANDGIWDWNLGTDEVYFSERWHEQLGLAPGSLSKSPEEWISRVHPDDRPGLLHAIRRHVDGYVDHVEFEHRVLHADGEYRWMRARGYKSRSSLDGSFYLAGSQTDITARRQAEEQLQHDAFHDALTGLPNRALLLDRLSQSIKVHRRDNAQRFALLYIDLDRFKFVNDSLGHASGDEALKEVARRWQAIIREYDTLARIGGDEFALLLEKIANREDVIAKAHRLLAELETPISVGGQDFTLGASIGVVFANETYETASDCLRDADSAMYQAKAAGRDQVVEFEPGMRAVVLQSFRVDTELREAIAADHLKLYYQPIVSTDDGSVCGYEALVRWFHPERGMIPPMDFIPFAEESGLIVHLDRWVIDAACRQVAEWQRAGKLHDDMHVSVNLSARQMGRTTLPEEVAESLQRHGIDGNAIKIELTETALISNIETAKDIMLRLRELGVGVVLDDFGTGYSSLSYLYQFPFDGIKVDQSFVRQLDKTENVGHLMELIQALGERMKVRVVPEGIEYETELTRLRQMGFRHAQGYYFGKPQPPEEAILAVNPVSARRVRAGGAK